MRISERICGARREYAPEMPWRPQVWRAGITGVLLVELGERAIEHGLSDDQFADQVHDRIDAGGIHAKRAFGNRGCRGTGSAGISCCAAFGGLGGPSDRFAACASNKSPSSHGPVSPRSSPFETHIETIEGIRSAGEVFLLAGTCQGRFDNFHGCGGDMSSGRKAMTVPLP